MPGVAECWRSLPSTINSRSTPARRRPQEPDMFRLIRPSLAGAAALAAALLALAVVAPAQARQAQHRPYTVTDLRTFGAPQAGFGNSPCLTPGGVATPRSGWSITPSPNPVIPTGQLFWVSCPAANWCMAVGTYVRSSGAGVTLAERWNGTSWRI